MTKEKTIILLILQKCGAMSKQKLIHLLYFCEFGYYERFGKELSGFTFMKTPRGIEILELDNLLKEMS